MPPMILCPVCAMRQIPNKNRICLNCQATIPEAVTDLSMWPGDGLQKKHNGELPPREIPARFKKKSLMSRLFPRSLSQKLALILGYGVGGTFFLLAILYLIGILMGRFKLSPLILISLFGLGAYFIQMGHRRD